MTTNEAWDAFFEITYSGRDFPNYSPLLGSDWAVGLPVNVTPEQYVDAACDRMVAKFGEASY